MAREYTEDECREMFLNYVKSIVRYWAELPDKTSLERCDGTAFSILVALDGEAATLPAFRVCPNPHPDDREWHKERAENWWPEDLVNISGTLHEDFCRKEP